ncbi:hypothetical protein QBC33DRAFT_331304 [Phialemonium atrogriseum]|uniref:Uncharacterized protein n=1 Tax=Phialemonium atrogriseum TaxID=1093897 RepID=A0AAJ0C3W3_9PEZI|nr:uncharacterized protein QBC33DRAFT_331304 [Phialemonium atrogriseum]KAK1769673.1 hypothetical protein QBC33DRAFT_331304 [Phialemonium atrogriseum]
MAIAVSSSSISPPDVRAIVAPVLATLPAAALSTQPAPIILPLLSPILRQRVQLLSSSSTDPWLRLLSYDTSKVPKLTEIAQRGTLEPHPVSGEIEVDWDYDAQLRFQRLDKETLHALVVLEAFDLFFRLVYCVGDKEGGGDGWRVGEVGVASDPSILSLFGGQTSVDEAERQFEASSPSSQPPKANGANRLYEPESSEEDGDEDEDDDDYWARYDATPARTPATKRSPAPQAAQSNPNRSTSAEDAYYAQYDSVQPAMDNDDPDEHQVAQAQSQPPLGLARPSASRSNGSLDPADPDEANGGAGTQPDPRPRSLSESSRRAEEEERAAVLVHPRPASSASSNGSLSVAKLEEAAGRREQGEFGVKQHVSRSIRSLFLLSRASGIDREEFERMVRTELDILGMVEDDI